MSFIEPWYLLGGLAVLIPVIIHLLKLNKPETVAFSTLAFFKELTDTTVKRLNIKRWLLLLFRILAILAITLALAQPTTKNDPNAALNGSKNSLWLLLDNSLSTGLSDDKGIRLYRITNQAKLWIEQLSSDAKVYLNVTHGQWDYNSALEPSSAIELLNQIQPSKGMDFFGIRLTEMMQQMDAISGPGNELRVLHDGQFHGMVNSIKTLKEQLPEASFEKVKIGYLPKNGDVANTWIENISTSNSWVSANKNMRLTVDLGRSVQASNAVIADTQLAQRQVQQKLAVYVNDRMISEQAIPENSLSLSAAFTPTKVGDFTIKAVISGDSYVLDNTYYTVLKVQQSLKILWITDNFKEQDRASSSFFNALNAASLSGYAIDIEAISPDNIPIDQLPSYQVLVVEGVTSWPSYADAAIRDYVQQEGGGLWLIPSATTNLNVWNQKTSAFGLPTFEGVIGEYASFKRQSSLERIRTNHPVFKGMFEDSKMEEEGWSPVIDSPNIYYYYKMGDLSGSFALLQTEERNPILVEKKLGKGMVWSMAMGFEPAWSDLSIKAIFAPLIFNGINFLNSANEGNFFAEQPMIAPLQFTTNQALLSNSALLNDSVRVSLVREQALASYKYRTVDPTITAGVLKLDSLSIALNAPKWESKDDYFSLSQYLDTEKKVNSNDVQSDLSKILDIDFVLNNVYEIDDATQNTGAVSTNKAIPIWSWFVLLALLCLLIESLISRYFRVQG